MTMEEVEEEKRETKEEWGKEETVDKLPVLVILP